MDTTTVFFLPSHASSQPLLTLPFHPRNTGKAECDCPPLPRMGHVPSDQHAPPKPYTTPSTTFAVFEPNSAGPQPGLVPLPHSQHRPESIAYTWLLLVPRIPGSRLRSRHPRGSARFFSHLKLGAAPRLRDTVLSPREAKGRPLVPGPPH